MIVKHFPKQHDVTSAQWQICVVLISSVPTMPNFFGNSRICIYSIESGGNSISAGSSSGPK